MAFSGFQDFIPGFGTALQRMIADNPGITVGSGYRSPERQAELYERAIQRYGSEKAARHWVAPPGHSQHNMGTAADLQFANDAARQWAHQHAADYGLNFRMGHEPWHIELANGGQAPATATATPTTEESTVASAFADALPQQPPPSLAAGRRPPIDRGDPTGLIERETASIAPIEIKPVAQPPELPLPQQQGQQLAPGLADLSPLAELFKVPEFGQAAAPKQPVRRA